MLEFSYTLNKFTAKKSGIDQGVRSGSEWTLNCYFQNIIKLREYLDWDKTNSNKTENKIILLLFVLNYLFRSFVNYFEPQKKKKKENGLDSSLLTTFQYNNTTTRCCCYCCCLLFTILHSSIIVNSEQRSLRTLTWRVDFASPISEYNTFNFVTYHGADDNIPSPDEQRGVMDFQSCWWNIACVPSHWRIGDFFPQRSLIWALSPYCVF